MILTVMELWASMDQYATNCYPLLREFSPVFPCDILNCLQLPCFEDMCRLQTIQDHLRKRHTVCAGTYLTIFSDPRKGCFGERFFNESADSEKFHEIQQQIEGAASLARAAKEEEWRELSANHEELSKEAAESTCLYVDDIVGHRIHNDRHCRKCYLERKANRIKIYAHEHPLPQDEYQLRTVIFELGCPKTFAVYRQVTWQILATLGLENQHGMTAPRVLLRDYSPFQGYNESDFKRLSLASTTKPFVLTHYASIRFPVDFSEVCMPNGLKFAYYDEDTDLWPGRQRDRPAFRHHCRLNFSNESVTSLFSYLSSPAGPEYFPAEEYPDMSLTIDRTAVTMDRPQRGQDRRLRAIHGFFQEDFFCERLLQLLEQRTNVIASNWRETNCMSMLISLGLRICSLVYSCNRKMYEKARTMLDRLRKITFEWTRELRTELQKASNAESYQRCSMYLLSTTLICKQTFSIFCESQLQLTSADLLCFVECSAVLQINLTDDPRSLPQTLRFALIRDIKMTHCMKGLIRSSVKDNPQALIRAIESIWPQPEGSGPRAYSSFQLSDRPDDWWIEIFIDTSSQSSKQTLHFHILEGHLLVNGQPPGKLPPKYMQSINVRRLFGD
ncbi:MAG: hypothetical protein Q9165_008318 [Trypethelium subeluteriae]